MSGISGVLIELAAIGNQDSYLNIRPRLTLFRGSYRRITNFAWCPIEQTFSSVAFGGSTSAALPRAGDLVAQLYVRALLPRDANAAAVVAGNPGANTLGNGAGFGFVDEAEISIGGYPFDKHSSVYMMLWNQLSHKPGAQESVTVLQGSQTDLQLWTATPGTGAASNSGLGSATGQPLFIPMQFWFNRFYAQALPMIALQYHEVKLSVRFDTAAHLSARGCGEASAFPPYAGGTPHASLVINYIFLDTVERRLFAATPHEYLIDQVHMPDGVAGVQAAYIDVLANDHDFSCETLSISSWDATSQAGGTVELALSGGNEILQYTPPALFFGNDSFSYTVLDLDGFTDTTSVSITVLTLGDIRVGSYCPQQYNTDSIQNAIDFYGGGIDQIIYIAPGTYTERLVIDRDVVIEAETIAAETVINAQSYGPAVEFASSFTGTVKISGLTIAKGTADNGGAFHVDGPVLIMHDCRLVGNWADDAGGAVLIESGTASFNGCAFWSNDSGGSGPAVVNAGGTCLLYQCDLTGHGSSGTAIHTQSGTTRLWQSVLCGNSGSNIDGPWQDLGENEISEICDCTPGGFNHPEDCDEDGVHDRCEIAAGTLTDENANGTADTCEEPPTLLAQWSSIECNGNDHWYELVPVPSGITWLSARGAAINRGGHLASLAEQAESDWVFGAIAFNEVGWNISPDGVAEGPWIGLFYSSSSGWVWLDSSPFAWSNWAPGEPSGNGAYCRLWGPGNNGFPVDTWDDVPNVIAPSYLVEWQTPEDCNGNGSPDERDIALGTSLDENGDDIPDECVPECIADLDGNGNVNGADLAILLGFWSLSGPADIDENGVVDGADLALLLGKWGDC